MGGAAAFAGPPPSGSVGLISSRRCYAPLFLAAMMGRATVRGGDGGMALWNDSNLGVKGEERLTKIQTAGLERTLRPPGSQPTFTPAKDRLYRST
jgi:hypothetical protein